MLIGLTGKKRSGKDTVARMLQEHGFVQTSFAAPIREFVAQLIGLSLDDLERVKESHVTDLGNVTPRHMMQTLGTEWGRQMIHPDIWTSTWAARYCMYALKGENIVVSDVRFPDEAELIRAHGGWVVEVQRPGLIIGDSHASEAGIPDNLIDVKLYNDCDLAVLRDRVSHMFGRFQHGGANG